MKTPAGPAKDEVAVAAAEAPEFEKVDWFKDPGLRRLYFLSAVGLMIASATTGYDGSLVNTVQQFDTWENYFDGIGLPNAGAHKTSLMGLLTNMYTIGSILSMFIVTFLTDHWGRKPPIIIGCVLMIIGGFITTFATSYGMLCGGRFILGLGNSLSQLSSPMLLTEIIHPRHRAPVTAVYNCLWNLGSLLCTFIAWGTSYVGNNWAWRSLMLLQIVPSICQITFIWFVPESPRWLISKDRDDEALAILAKFHANGDANNATVQFEFREIRDTLQLEKHARDTSTYLDFMKTRGNRWRLAIIVTVGLISQYSGNAVISNYMNDIYIGAGINDQNRKLGLSSGKTVVDLTASITAAFFVDKVGRRPLFLLSIIGMIISFALWTVTAAEYDASGKKNSWGYAQIVFIWIFGIFYDIGWSGLLVAYTLEVLPFHLRAKGVMIMNITVQATLALGAQTNLLAWNNLPSHWNFCLFYTLWDVVEGIWVYFVFVETKGPTLEEIAKIFDGEDAVAHISLEQVEKEIQMEGHAHTAEEADRKSG